MPLQLTTTPATDAWRSIMTAFTRINRVLSDEMATETGMSVDRYGILLMLSQADEGSMRMSDLADQVALSRSAATRLVDRLEQEGLVTRGVCDTDRRGTFVILTAVGEEEFKRAGRIHLRGIEEHVGSHLTSAEMAQLSDLLDKLSAGVDDAALSFLPPEAHQR
jgi:DNA-binding MarR family transcriptional regulator